MTEATTPVVLEGEVLEPEGAPKSARRAKDADIPKIMELVSEGRSLRHACRILGLHQPSTHAFIKASDAFRDQYARAREDRAEYYAERALTVTEAAAFSKEFDGNKIDPAGARVYLDAIKWATARMAPASEPTKRVHIQFEDMTSDQRRARIADYQARLGVIVSADDREPDAADG